VPGLVRLLNKRRGRVVFAIVPGMGRVGPGRMRAKRVDANHGEIKRAFERMGCDVLDLSGVGQGCPDLLVKDRSDALRLVEVKDGKKRPSKRALTGPQKDFHAVWPVTRVESVDDVMAIVSQQG